MNKLVLIVAFAANTFCATAQEEHRDSAYLLKNVEIRSIRNKTTRINYLNEVFSANALQNQISDMYIKNYGVGQLSTFSVRGLGPENVSILWYGIPVNSPMNGLLDINQIPNSLLQNIQYQLDGNRLTSGGALRIDPTKSDRNLIVLSSTAYTSSLFTHKTDGQFHIGKSRLSLINQLTHGSNNFQYLDNNGTKTRLHHNSVQQINTQAHYSYDFQKWSLNAGFWYQNQDRQIPISNYYPVETQSLIDRNGRAYVGASGSTWDVKLSFHNESQKYNDRDAFFPSESIHKVISYRGVVEKSINANDKLKLNYKLYPSIHEVRSTGLSDSSLTILEATQQIGANYQISNNLILEGQVKTQLNTNFNNIILPSLAIGLSIDNHWTSKVTADINVRNPTLNDLYFQFLGNTKLRPETNYQIKNTWTYTNDNAFDKVRLMIEPYYIHSVDKINYVPDSGFKVFNIDRSTSLGIASNIEWLRKLSSEYSLRTIFGVNFINATNHLNQNLTYVPNLKSTLSFGLIHQDFELLAQHNYTSQRYTNLANSMSLNPYFLMNLRGTYKHYIGTSQMQFTLGIDNLLNENYQEINGNFMPLRNYFLQVTALLR